MDKINVGVIALGLIGGSLVKALADKENIELYAVTRNQETIKSAENFVKEISCDFNILKNCDIVFICTPIEKTIETIEKVKEVVSSSCLIADTASVKGFINEYAKENNIDNFIGTHPMAGTENKGFEASFAELFEDAKWILTETKQNTDLIEKVIKLTGAKIIKTDSKSHDLAVSFISHAPMIISEAIVSSVENIQDENFKELTKKLASSGFRDTTRLAMSNPEMAKDMVKYNHQNIKEVLEKFSEESKKLLENDYFNEKIENIITSRQKMYKDGKNIL